MSVFVMSTLPSLNCICKGVRILFSMSFWLCPLLLPSDFHPTPGYPLSACRPVFTITSGGVWLGVGYELGVGKVCCFDENNWIGGSATGSFGLGVAFSTGNHAPWG